VRSSTAAEWCEDNGWTAGTVLEAKAKDTPGGVVRVRVTAVGDKYVLAVKDGRESVSDLRRHAWRKVDSGDIRAMQEKGYPSLVGRDDWLFGPYDDDDLLEKIWGDPSEQADAREQRSPGPLPDPVMADLPMVGSDADVPPEVLPEVRTFIDKNRQTIEALVARWLVGREPMPQWVALNARSSR
jgi:hypothetical protein